MRKKGRKLFAMLFLAMLVVVGSTGKNIGVKQVQAAEYERYSARVQNLQQTGWGTTTAAISWEVQENNYDTTQTEGYHIWLGTSYSDLKLVGTAKEKTYTLNNLQDGKRYYVKVEPFSTSGKTSSNTLAEKIETIPAKVRNFRQNKWWFFIHQLEVGWDGIETADKVEVTLYNSKGKRVGKPVTVNKYSTTASFSKMKDEVYTVTIQAFKTVNGKTYSTPKAKIQCFNQARISYAKAKSKNLTVRWGKVGGATGYDVYVSTNPKKGYKKVKSVGKNTTKLTIRKYKGKKISPKKTYYVYVETKKKNGSRVNKSGRLYYWNTKDSSFGYF